MFDVQAILTRAQMLGLRLCVEEGRIAIAQARLCPPELLFTIREHKPQIMSLLEARATGLPPDCAPWLNVARQILDGEFDGLLDSSVRESLKIGLRSIRHPVCERALARLVISSRGHHPRS